MTVIEHLENDETRLASLLADDLTKRLQDAAAARGAAVLALSGGRSPIPLMRALRERAVPWPQLTVTLVDDRCVPHDHADSNAGLVREHLLAGAAQQARFVPLFDALPGNDTVRALTHGAEARIRALEPIDVAVLGMGLDGHTASLFAPQAERAGALDPDGAARCAWIEPQQAPHARVTLTLAALLRCGHLALQIDGADKRAVYERARTHADPAHAISLVLNQERVPVEVWIGA